MEWPHDELNHIAGWIAKTRQRANLPRRARLRGPNGGFNALLRQLRDGSVELRLAVYLEAHGPFRGLAEKEDQRVIAHVGAKVSGLFTPVDQLQAKYTLSEIDCGGKVACPKSNVSEMVDRDHVWRSSLGLEARSR
jgi:hypothetical protein